MAGRRGGVAEGVAGRREEEAAARGTGEGAATPPFPGGGGREKEESRMSLMKTKDHRDSGGGVFINRPPLDSV